MIARGARRRARSAEVADLARRLAALSPEDRALLAALLVGNAEGGAS